MARRKPWPLGSIVLSPINSGTSKPSRDMKTAFITGITGQDGSYLAELLLQKGYAVHGLVRRSSMLNTGRIEHLCDDRNGTPSQIELHYGDLTDAGSLDRALRKAMPDE